MSKILEPTLFQQEVDRARRAYPTSKSEACNYPALFTVGTSCRLSVFRAQTHEKQNQTETSFTVFFVEYTDTFQFG